MIYAVIDTNVLVSALITRNHDSATVKVFRHLLRNDVTPLYNETIISEYREVLSRGKFQISNDVIERLISFFREKGINADGVHTDIAMPDESDRVFYEISLSKEDSFLVTGNLKHYPVAPRIVSPSEFLRIAGF